MKHFPVEGVFFQGETLRVETLSQGVKRVVLMRAELRNAFNETMIVELSEAFTRLAAVPSERELRLVVLQGEGHMFCAGADISYMKAQAERGESGSFEDARKLGRLFFKLALLPVPVVAAVRGAALGGGFGLAVCSDYVVAEEDAVFATPEIRLGIVPGVISPYIVRKLGVAHAQKFMLGGTRIKASECVASGLVSRLVTAGESFDDVLGSVASTLLHGAPNASRRTKELIRKSAPVPGPDVFEYCAMQIAQARTSEEGRDGLTSFLEKRSPSWQVGLPKERP